MNNKFKCSLLKLINQKHQSMAESPASIAKTQVYIEVSSQNDSIGFILFKFSVCTFLIFIKYLKFY